MPVDHHGAFLAEAHPAERAARRVARRGDSRRRQRSTGRKQGGRHRLAARIALHNRAVDDEGAAAAPRVDARLTERWP